MFGALGVVVVAIHAVFVGAYPDAVLGIHDDTHDTGGANGVTGTQLMTHIMEALEADWLHEDTFL